MMTGAGYCEARTGVRTLDVATGTLSAVAAEVTELFEGLFVDIERMRVRLVDLFSAGPVDSVEASAAVDPVAHELLGRGVVLGSGYVAARDALTDHPLYLAWWQGESQQLLGQADAPAGDPLDYTRREWFRVPESTGRRHITGPYVDYVCTDEYVVTSTMPVVVEGKMRGVVGADTLVETLEDVLMDTLRSGEATLVSANGRVVASADHRLGAGTLVDLEKCSERLECGTLPLLVVQR